jgi:hypothetical protein
MNEREWRKFKANTTLLFNAAHHQARPSAQDENILFKHNQSKLNV